MREDRFANLMTPLLGVGGRWRPLRRGADERSLPGRFRLLPWRPGALLVSLLAVLLLTSPALSATRIGTNNGETLIGTNGNDQFTGKGGNDTLKGLAGNDVYYFDDNFGSDTLEENAKYRVAGKRVSGGVDTISLAQVDSGYTDIHLIRQWGPNWNRVGCGCNGGVTLGASVVENATAGSNASSYDIISGGAEKNTMQPGGGVQDYLTDYGGFKPVGDDTRVALPVSNDTYKGFGEHGGTVFITDFGGAGDVLDLRPFAVGDVYLDAVNLDPTVPPPGGTGGNTTEESLQIVTGGTHQVLVRGHFSPFFPQAGNNQQGRIETIIFADGTFSGNGVVGAAAAASTSGGNPDLEKVAGRLLAEALRAQDLNVAEIARRGGGEGGGGDITPGPVSGKAINDKASSGKKQGTDEQKAKEKRQDKDTQQEEKAKHEPKNKNAKQSKQAKKRDKQQHDTRAKHGKRRALPRSVDPSGRGSGGWR